MRPAEPAPSERAVFYMIGAVLIVGVLIWAKSVLIPIAISILLSFALAPLVSRAQRAGLSRTWAATVVVITGVVGFLILMYMIEAQTSTLITKLPEYGKNLSIKLRGKNPEKPEDDAVKKLMKRSPRSPEAPWTRPANATSLFTPRASARLRSSPSGWCRRSRGSAVSFSSSA